MVTFIHKKKKPTSFQVIILGFSGVILLGTILLMYLALFFTGGLFISIMEGLPMLTCLFETASAVGTVGLTLGITPELGTVSRLILILLMFLGRVGGLTLVFAALSSTKKTASRLPKEKITVG